MNQSICARGKRRRNFCSNGMVCTTSPSADGLTNRMRQKSCERSDSVFKRTLSAFLANTRMLTQSAARRQQSEDFFHCRRKAMPALLAAHDFLARDPIELDHSPLAGKGLVTMPRIVAALEREERPLHRRHFKEHVIQVGSRFQQS